MDWSLIKIFWQRSSSKLTVVSIKSIFKKKTNFSLLSEFFSSWYREPLLNKFPAISHSLKLSFNCEHLSDRVLGTAFSVFFPSSSRQSSTLSALRRGERAPRRSKGGRSSLAPRTSPWTPPAQTQTPTQRGRTARWTDPPHELTNTHKHLKYLLTVRFPPGAWLLKQIFLRHYEKFKIQWLSSVSVMYCKNWKHRMVSVQRSSCGICQSRSVATWNRGSPRVNSYQHPSVLHVCLCVLHTVAVSQLTVVTGALTVLFVPQIDSEHNGELNVTTQ